MRFWLRLLPLLPLFGAWGFLSTAAAAQWEQAAGYRRIHVEINKDGKTGFALMPPETSGITFSNLLPEALGLTNHVFQDGSGVAAGDIDGDGKCDLYFCAISGSNRLFRKLGGW